MTKKTAYILLIIFSLGIAAYFSYQAGAIFLGLKSKHLKSPEHRVKWKLLGKEIKEEIAHFEGEAGIVIKDLGSGGQILINQDKLFPSASLVKIPVMAAYFYAAHENKLKLDEVLILGSQHKVLGSGVLKNASIGTKLSIKNLIELMIAESDNTATNMLVEHLGFDYLNECFKKLGLRYTNISRKMMDFRERRNGKENFTTASEMAGLLEEIYNKTLINRTYSQICLEFLKKQKIKDRIPARLPADATVAHKTGLERGLCHDAGIVFTPKGDFLICILTKHRNKTAKPTKKIIAQLASLVYNYY